MKNPLVIIPTYNEKENIRKMVDTVLSLNPEFDLLIIDDNSPDGTGQIIADQQKNYPDRLHLIEREGKQGLGTAYLKGFQWGLDKGYEYLCEMDADFSHNPYDLIRLYETCKNENAGLVIGSRYKSGVNVVNWPIGRVLMSYFASKYVRVITGMKIHDTTAGFKCYHRKVLETIPFDKIRFKGYAFQIEMKFITWIKKFEIIEIPIIFTDRKLGQSKMSGGIFNEALWGVITMKIRSFFNNYQA